MSEIGTGQDMLHIPFGEMITSIAMGIAEAQQKMDQSSMNVAEMMSGQRILRNMESGEPILKEDGSQTALDSRVYFGNSRQPQGFGATATAKIPNAAGSLKEILILNPGGKVHKKKNVIVSFVGGGGSGAEAEVDVDDRNGKITKIEITKRGSGYTSAPEVKITGLGRGAKSDAEFQCILGPKKGSVESITIDDKGEGYTIKPVVNIIGEGTGAEVEVTVSAGKVTGYRMINGGEGYDPKNTFVEFLPQNKLVPQKLSMIELGFVPNFYQFVDTVINMRVALKVTRNEFGKYQVHAANVDANYASSYNYNLEVAALVQTKIVPIPPPIMLEERIKNIIFEEQPEEDTKKEDS